MADPPRHAQHLGSAPVPQIPVIPQRYALREKDGTRFLECDEAPRVRAVIDPAMSASRAEAGLLGERVILLDGAGSFGPLIDNEHKLYNLDHHAGCERLFTLSTCEQALLLVESGLELSDGDWTLYANDPDLDTVLALWCLLNHRRVRELGDEARDVLLPLFRLEGAIDANGPQLARLCGLPTWLLAETEERIDGLLARERHLKQTGAWTTKDVHTYTLEMLREVDALVYWREDFGDYAQVDEIYGYVEIAPRRVAVACRDGAGIYTVEQHLKERWGEQLSVIALENEPRNFTLRRVNSLSGTLLEPAYELLNRIDPAVDGRPPGKRWGGSADIGGSPRPAGTLLTPAEVLDAVARAHRPTSRWSTARRTGGAWLLGVSVLLLWPLASRVAVMASSLAIPPGVLAAYEVAFASFLALGISIAITRTASQYRPWVFGWRAPANGGGWWLGSLAFLGGLPVVAWASQWVSAGAVELVAVLAAGTLGLAALEVWFRGVVHGLLVLDFAVQRPGGPWLLSRAAFVSSTAYALVATVLIDPDLDGGWLAWPDLSGLPLLGAVGGLAFVVGLALAALRERCASLVPGIAFQVAGLLAAIAVGYSVA